MKRIRTIGFIEDIGGGRRLRCGEEGGDKEELGEDGTKSRILRNKKIEEKLKKEREGKVRQTSFFRL